MAKKWQSLSRKMVFSCQYYDLWHDTYRLPDGVGRGDYYYLHLAGSVMIVPQLPSGELVFVLQHRYLFDRLSLELPAGGIRQGGDPLVTAQQELAEEAGYAAASWTQLGSFAPYNGASNEICSLFLAQELAQVAVSPESTEEIEVLSMPVERAKDKIRSGELWDGMTITALALYEQHLRGGGR